MRRAQHDSDFRGCSPRQCTGCAVPRMPPPRGRCSLQLHSGGSAACMTPLWLRVHRNARRTCSVCFICRSILRRRKARAGMRPLRRQQLSAQHAQDVRHGHVPRALLVEEAQVLRAVRRRAVLDVVRVDALHLLHHRWHERGWGARSTRRRTGSRRRRPARSRWAARRPQASARRRSFILRKMGEVAMMSGAGGASVRGPQRRWGWAWRIRRAARRRTRARARRAANVGVEGAQGRGRRRHTCDYGTRQPSPWHGEEGFTARRLGGL